jgi:hypothetical protein
MSALLTFLLKSKEYGTGRESAEKIGVEYQTCRNLAWVAGEVELSRRRDNLSFSHHAEIADLPPAKQDKWLARAALPGRQKT